MDNRWKCVGKLGGKKSEVVMVVPCSVKEHHPVEGKGYMLCVVKKLDQSKAEARNWTRWTSRPWLVIQAVRLSSFRHSSAGMRIIPRSCVVKTGPPSMMWPG